MASEFELSEKNQNAFEYYRRARAPLGGRLPADGVTLAHHALLDEVTRAYEVDRLASALREIQPTNSPPPR